MLAFSTTRLWTRGDPIGACPGRRAQDDRDIDVADQRREAAMGQAAEGVDRLDLGTEDGLRAASTVSATTWSAVAVLMSGWAGPLARHCRVDNSSLPIGKVPVARIHCRDHGARDERRQRFERRRAPELLDDDQRVAAWIRAYRLRRNLTLAQLSELSGVSIGHLSRLENGTRTPTVRLLLQLARALGCLPRRARG